MAQCYRREREPHMLETNQRAMIMKRDRNLMEREKNLHFVCLGLPLHLRASCPHHYWAKCSMLGVTPRDGMEPG